MTFYSAPLKHPKQNPYGSIMPYPPPLQPPPSHLPRYDDDRSRDPPPSSSYRDSYHAKRKRDDEQDYYPPHHGYPDQEHHHRESFAPSFDSYDNDRSRHNPPPHSYSSQHHRPLSPPNSRQRASTPPPPPPPHYSSPYPQRNGHYQQGFSKRPRSMSPERPERYNNQHERPYTNNKYHNQHKYNQNKYLVKGQIKYTPNYRQHKLSFNKFHYKHNNANLQPQYLPFDNHHHRHYPSASSSLLPAPTDTIQDEAVRQRVIRCFEDTIFISTANFADHYWAKYGRRITLNDFRPFSPQLESVSIMGDSQVFLRRAHPSFTPRLSRRQPMNSLRIMRNRLARLCSSVATKLAVKDMYIHVYGRRPDFPLIVDDDIDGGEALSRDREEQNQGQEKSKQIIHDWDELLKLVPLDRKYLEEVRAPALWEEEDDPTAKLLPLIVRVKVPVRLVRKATSSDREEDEDEVEEDDDDESISPSESSRHRSATSSATPTPTRETDAVRDQQDEMITNQDVGTSDRRPPPPSSSDPGLIAAPHLQASSSPYTPNFPPTPASSSPLPPNHRASLPPSSAVLKLPSTAVPEAISVELNSPFENSLSKVDASAALDSSNRYRENEREPEELGELRNPGESGEPGESELGEMEEQVKLGELEELVESPESDSPPNPASDLHMMKLKIMKLFEDVMFVAMSSLPWHYERKYGQNLDVPGRLSQWVQQHFPTTLNQVRFHDLDPSTLFLTLAHRPPMRLMRRTSPKGHYTNPSSPPQLPYSILRVRLARLCFTHNSNAAVFYRMYTTAYGQLSPQQFPMPIKRRPSSTSPVSQQSGTHWARADTWEDLLRIVRAEIGGRGSGWWGASEFRAPPLYGDEEKILEAEEKGKDVLGEVKLVHECRRPGLGSRWLEFVGSDGWRVDWGGKTEGGDEGIVEMEVDKDEEEEESAEGSVRSPLLATSPDASMVSVERKKMEEFERVKDEVRMKAAEFERARGESKSRVAEVERAKDEPRTKVVEAERSRDEIKTRDEHKMEDVNMPPQPPAVPRVYSLTERQRLMLQLMFQVNNVLPYPKRKMIDL